jgi:hypothetical protein
MLGCCTKCWGVCNIFQVLRVWIHGAFEVVVRIPMQIV